jgi:hypothetical protein
VTRDQSDTPPPRRRTRHVLATVAVIAAVALAAVWALMKTRVLRAPYPAVGKAFARVTAAREEAYNFDRVAPGVYRSARPDAALVRYVHGRYNVTRLISLNGYAENEAAHEQAWLLGLKVTVFRWPSHSPPPTDQVRAALKLLLDADAPVWFHCSSGADRTGLLAACYRVRAQGWPIERAVDEMRDYWHDPESNPAMTEALRAALDGPTRDTP